MKFYIVKIGEDFTEAKLRQEYDNYESVQEALEYGKLILEPGKKFMVCDSKGGVLAISKVSELRGNA